MPSKEKGTSAGKPMPRDANHIAWKGNGTGKRQGISAGKPMPLL
jgi:hypothetical protein